MLLYVLCELYLATITQSDLKGRHTCVIVFKCTACVLLMRRLHKVPVKPGATLDSATVMAHHVAVVGGRSFVAVAGVVKLQNGPPAEQSIEAWLLFNLQIQPLKVFY